MRIGHYISGLNTFGTERLLEMLLRYRSSEMRDQFVVAANDGPMRSIYGALGVQVHVARDTEETARLLRGADLVNLHLLFPNQIPDTLTGEFPAPRIATIHWTSTFPGSIFDHFIATSQAARGMQLDPAQVTLIPNGVDLERFHGKRVPHSPRVILRACRADKCAEYFWYGITPVLAAHPDTELWLAGTSGSATGRVRPLGVVSDLAEVFSRSSLFVHIPKQGEGSRDLVVMEAMAMGLPCVMADVSCVRESVGTGDLALLVQPDDADMLAAAVDYLLRDPAAAAELGKRARKFAVEQLDFRPRVAEYEAVYSRVVREAGHRWRPYPGA